MVVPPGMVIGDSDDQGHDVTKIICMRAGTQLHGHREERSDVAIFQDKATITCLEDLAPS